MDLEPSLAKGIHKLGLRGRHADDKNRSRP
jgi:hypothetical protein